MKIRVGSDNKNAVMLIDLEDMPLLHGIGKYAKV